MITLITKEWQLSDIKGVIFDKDGTLIDSHVYWGRIIHRRANALIKYFNLKQETYPELCKTMGFSLEKKKLLPEGPIGLVSRQEVISIVNNFLLKLNPAANEKDIARIFSEEHELFNKEIYDYITLLPGAKDLLIKLKEYRISCAVVTSDTVKNAREIFDHFGIINLIDIFIGIDSTKEEKKTGIPAKIAMNHLNLSPNEVVVIGDAPMDIIMAKNANIKAAIGVTTGQTEKSVFRNHTDYIIDNLTQIFIK
jgi:HAD superfamily hydrolase (TIGR01549 family)